MPPKISSLSLEAQAEKTSAEIVEETVELKAEQAPEAEIKDTIFPKELEDKIRLEQKTKTGRRAALWLLGLAVVVVLAVVFLVLPKATVIVYPKTESVSRDLEITLSASATAPDSAQLIFPAVKISEQLEASSTFQSQGKQQVGNKADGTVRIYNFTKAPINLKAATTVLSVNGQNYIMVPDLVQIKPTKYSNAATKEVDQNSLGDPVEITAQTGAKPATCRPAPGWKSATRFSAASRSCRLPKPTRPLQAACPAICPWFPPRT